MARIVDESFEGTGYEESWSETVGTGCTCDEDSAGPGSLPPNGGSQCLRIVKAGTAQNVFTWRTFTAPSTLYLRAYVYIASEALTNGQTYDVVVSLFSDSANTTIGGFKLSKTAGGVLQLVANYNNGSWQDLGTSNVSTATWYCLEYHQNTSTGAVQAWVDDVSIGSVTGQSLPRGAGSDLVLGPRWAGNQGLAAGLTMYADMIVVENATRVGPEGGSAAMSLVIPSRAIVGSVLAR